MNWSIRKEFERTWERLSKSALSRKLLLFFGTIALIDSVFLLCLCQDTLKVESIAATEHKLLKLSLRLSQGFPGLQFWNRLSNSTTDESFNLTHSPVATFQNYKQTIQELADFGNSVNKELLAQKVYNGPSLSMLRSLKVLDEKVSERIQPDEFGKAKPFLSFADLFEMAHSVLLDLRNQSRALHSVLQGHAAATEAIELHSRNLLSAAIITDTLLVLFVVVWVQRSITGPITRLVRECQKLRRSEIFTVPKLSSDDIGILQSSFYEMSCRINIAEKRRASYLELFRSAQSVSLDKAREIIDFICSNEQFSNHELRSKVLPISSSLKSLSKLLNSMSDVLSSNQAQAIVLNPAHTCSTRIIEDALSSVKSLAQVRNINFQVEDKNFDFHADEALLVRVLTNLLSNAIKYSPDNASVAISACAVGEGVLCFAVSDAGPGIRAEKMKDLFRKFSQIEAHDGLKRAGTGLGLLICKQIIDAHHGQIGCQSEAGKGSCFSFQIPLEQKSEFVKTNTRSNLKLDDPGMPSIIEAKDEAKGLGIKRMFALVLACFLVPQIFLGLNLNKNLQDTAKRAKLYRSQRTFLINAQDLLVEHAQWKASVFHDFQQTDIFTVGEDLLKAVKELNKQSAQIRWLIKHAEPGSPILDASINLYKHQRQLRTLMMPAANLDISSKQLLRGNVLARQVQDDLNLILQLSAENLQASYDLSIKLRAEIVKELVWTIWLNLFALAAAAALAYRLTNNVFVLRNKTLELAQGGQIQVTLSGNDEFSQLDQSLYQASEAIKNAELQKQELINIVNHDLRAPLAAALGSCQLLLMDEGHDETPLAAALNKVEFELNALLARINDLLLIEKIDAGAYHLAAEDLDLSLLIDQAITNVMAYSSQAELELDISNSSLEAKIRGESDLFRRLLEIVLSNAQNASSIDGKVILCAYCSDKQLHISVEDNAGGISRDVLLQPFERFRFQNGKPVAGLGLPLAKRICNILDASIELQSNSVGTKVNLQIPVIVDCR